MSDAARNTVAIHGWREQDHGTVYGRVYCRCGWSAPRIASLTEREQHAAHVLAVLSETHAVVELPAATVTGDVHAWGSVRDDFHTTANPESGGIHFWTPGGRVPNDDVEMLAARILAAVRVARSARAAEGGDPRG